MWHEKWNANTFGDVSLKKGVWTYTCWALLSDLDNAFLSDDRLNVTEVGKALRAISNHPRHLRFSEEYIAMAYSPAVKIWAEYGLSHKADAKPVSFWKSGLLSEVPNDFKIGYQDKDFIDCIADAANAIRAKNIIINFGDYSMSLTNSQLSELHTDLHSPGYNR